MSLYAENISEVPLEVLKKELHSYGECRFTPKVYIGYRPKFGEIFFLPSVHRFYTAKV